MMDGPAGNRGYLPVRAQRIGRVPYIYAHGDDDRREELYTRMSEMGLERPERNIDRNG